MNQIFSRYAGAAVIALLCQHAGAANAEPSPEPANSAEPAGHWRLTASPYSLHFNPSDEHEPVWAIGLEWQRNDRWLAGGSYFSNSFGQPSGYVYVGQRHEGLLDHPALFWQWSAGLMYGYRGEYKDKVPLNVNGFSPGALLSLGWKFDRQLSTQINLLGAAGLMWQLSWDLH